MEHLSKFKWIKVHFNQNTFSLLEFSKLRCSITPEKIKHFPISLHDGKRVTCMYNLKLNGSVEKSLSDCGLR